MLIIRNAQLELFQQVSFRLFRDQLLERLRTRHTQAIALGDDFPLWLDETLQRAGSEGFSTVDELALYTEIVLLHGPSFREQPWAQVLQRRDLPPDVARAMFVARAREQSPSLSTGK